ncbi:SdpI family protein [Corynebacterium felinum]|uniref:SdpI/YhfL protein family protein n=1 Tax=Corynebacterium felinum TaxID=131318 RepID=A0ABU2B7I2_9CORY|nr:SdpI family protein [Corynebacterium felinum]MDF5819618.1 SdpI family protein [Corynebacterium felinum]MDR7354251.1 hypothetical protein [Corynebacterium felinum]WJY96419.1 hypothetical protein CFELI_14240 [Corynebacterium felinum]
MMILGSILALLSVFLLIVGGLAWTRHLPGNKYVGIKVPEVRKSKENWDTAHQFAGPLWVAAGAAMAIAAVPPFSGISWLLIFTLIGFIAALYFLGLGASLATRAAGVMGQEHESDGCSSDSGGCCGGASNADTDAHEHTSCEDEGDMPCETTGSCDPSGCSGAGICNEAPTTIDLAALRRAAEESDK